MFKFIKVYVTKCVFVVNSQKFAPTKVSHYMLSFSPAF